MNLGNKEKLTRQHSDLPPLLEEEDISISKLQKKRKLSQIPLGSCTNSSEPSSSILNQTSAQFPPLNNPFEPEVSFKAPITIGNFETLRSLRDDEMRYAFVDKTLLIKEIMQHEARSMLIIRPRRWGKSINLSMLYSYLSNTIKQSNLYEKIFKGTKIYDEKEFNAEHANKYPVIYIDFTKFASNSTCQKNWPIGSFSTSLHQVKRDYGVIIQESKSISNMTKEKALNHFSLEPKNILTAIRDLATALEAIYDEKVIVLIDEYDLPIHQQLNKQTNDDINKVLEMYRNFFTAGLKNNTSVRMCLLTGCVRVSLTRTLSGLNNFKSYSLLDPQFQEFYGFTESEALELIQEVRGNSPIDEEEKKLIRAYYNGYMCPAGSKCSQIYNAYSIVEYAHEGKGRFADYWNRTGGMQLIERVFKNKEAETNESLFKLIGGGSITVNLSSKITLEELDKPESLGATLFYAGYLTLANEKDTAAAKEGVTDDFYEVTIPNTDARKALVELTEQLSPKMQDIDEYQIRTAFINNKLQIFKEEVNKWISAQKELNNISGRTLSSEACYHNLIYWNLARILRNEWIVMSERHVGKEYFDITVIPEVESGYTTAYLIEIKFLSQTLGDDLQEKKSKMDKALQQIEDRKYVEHFNPSKYSYITKIQKIGILGCDCKIEVSYFP